jgi:hypothetical protein
MKGFRILAVAGAVALAPTVASAFNGNLVTCTPTGGIKTQAFLKPGLQCAELKNKLIIKKSAMDGCSATAASSGGTGFCTKAGKPSACCTGVGTGVGCTVWDIWSAGKLNSKITGANAALIDNVLIDIKGQAFGSCNFSGSANSFAASGAAKLAFLDAGGNKVKGGKLQAFGTVGGDLATQSAETSGLVTKGFAAGAKINILIGIDLGGASDCGDGAGSCNGNVLSCNLGFACPPDIAPSYILDLITNGTSELSIHIEDNSDCTANDDPYPCCTGAGTGNC